MSYTDWINLAFAALIFVVAPIAAVFYVVHTVRHRGWRALGARLRYAMGVVLATSWTVLVAAWKTIGWIAAVDDRDEPMTNQEDPEFNRGGDWNYRTGRGDDGMDPAGWYGKDLTKPKY
jgi:hypothetical protein